MGDTGVSEIHKEVKSFIESLVTSLFPTSGFTKEGFEAACAKYIAHDVSIVTPSGKRLGLAEFKSKFIGDSPTRVAFEKLLSVDAVKLLGPGGSVAVATGRTELQHTPHGGPTKNVCNAYTWVATKQAGGWKLEHMHRACVPCA